MQRDEPISQPISGTGTEPMIEGEHVTPQAPARERATRSRWPLVVAVLAGLAIIAAVAAWWFLNSRAQIPDWDRAAEVDFIVPAGDAFESGTPWVRLHVSPLRTGGETTVRAALDTTRGTPAAASDASRAIESVTFQPLSSEQAAQPLALQRDESGAVVATAPTGQTGWWRLEVVVSGAPRAAELYLLVPDPNINGPNAVPGFASSTDGEALFQRGLAATTALQTVRYTQWIADGRGNASVSQQAVVAPQGDRPGGFTYRAIDGMQAVIIGSTRWLLLPGTPDWQREEGAISVPPSEWGEEYTGATGFTVLGDESIDGRPARRVAFVVPEETEPRRRTVAWYLWWVDTETGHVLKEAMVSRVHYMLYRFGNFDEPLSLVPPEQPATPAPVGTPAA